MTLQPQPAYKPILVKAVIPRSPATRLRKINPWIPADEPVVTICKSDAGYELKEGEIKPTWQMYRVLTGQEKKHFGLVRLNPEKPSPTILGDTGCTTAGLVHPYEIRKLTIAEIKALASYPAASELIGSYRTRWTCIGNSVPPLFVRAVARHIRCRFFRKTSAAGESTMGGTRGCRALQRSRSPTPSLPILSAGGQ